MAKTCPQNNEYGLIKAFIGMLETNLGVESSGVVATPQRIWLAWPANFSGSPVLQCGEYVTNRLWIQVGLLFSKEQKPFNER